VSPECVVRAWIAGCRRSIEALPVCLFERLRFLLGQRLSRGKLSLNGTLQRRRRLAVPLSLQVRITPRRARRRPVLRDRRRGGFRRGGRALTGDRRRRHPRDDEHHHERAELSRHSIAHPDTSPFIATIRPVLARSSLE